MTRTTRAAVEISSAIGLVFCIVGTASAADQIPNIKGKWVGKTHFDRCWCCPTLAVEPRNVRKAWPI